MATGTACRAPSLGLATIGSEIVFLIFSADFGGASLALTWNSGSSTYFVSDRQISRSVRCLAAFDHFKKFAPKGKFFEMLSWGGLGGGSPPRNLHYPSFVVCRRRRHPPEIGRYGFGRKKPPSENDSYFLNVKMFVLGTFTKAR